MTEFVFIEERPTAGKTHRVSAGVSIGRGDCDILVEDPEVSRRHLELRVAGSAIAVEDLGSTHGTFVNGRQVQTIQELEPGDRVEFGATVWRLEPVAAEAAPAEPAAPEPEAAPAPPAARVLPEPPPSREFPPSRVPEPAPEPAAPRAAPAQAAAPQGDAFREPRTKRGRSAARSLQATAVSYGIVGATAVALVVYFAQRGG